MKKTVDFLLYLLYLENYEHVHACEQFLLFIISQYHEIRSIIVETYPSSTVFVSMIDQDYTRKADDNAGIRQFDWPLVADSRSGKKLYIKFLLKYANLGFKILSVDSPWYGLS